MEEVLRILHTGGKFVCVETSQPKWRVVNAFYHLYLNKVVPLVGGLISGHKGAYRYLGTSALNFPRAEQIAGMLLRTGFRKVSYDYMTFGIVAKHVGTK